MRYPHGLTITRTAPGEPDGLGGTTPGETTTVYEGKADVQDGGAEIETDNGVVTEEGDATAFLPKSVASVQVGDDATITWGDGATRAATVAKAVRLDNRLVLSYD